LAAFQAGGVAQGGGQVEVGVLLVDAHVGTIGLVAIERVAENNGAIGGGGYVPAVGVGPVHGQRVVGTVGGNYVVHVFGKIMQGVAAGRAAGHAHVQRPARQPRKSGRNPRLVVHRIWKRHGVANSRSCIGFGLGLRTE